MSEPETYWAQTREACNQAITDVIRSNMERYKMSQVDLATEADIHTTMVSRLLNHHYNMSEEMTIKILKVFHQDPLDVIPRDVWYTLVHKTYAQPAQLPVKQ